MESNLSTKAKEYFTKNKPEVIIHQNDNYYFKDKIKRGPGQPKKHEQKLVQANFRVLATKRNDFRIKVNSFLKEYQK